MGSIATFTQLNQCTQPKVASLWAPLQGLLGFFVPQPAVAHAAPRRLATSADIASARVTPTRALRHRNELAARPLTCFSARLPTDGLGPGKTPSRLRILREFEPGASPSCAGRMVISGRMADICDELDRMIRADSRSH